MPPVMSVHNSPGTLDRAAIVDSAKPKIGAMPPIHVMTTSDHATTKGRMLRVSQPAAFIGYGGVGGARAVEQLRLITVELQMAPTRSGVHIAMEPYLAVVKEGKSLADFDYLNKSAVTMLDELSWWAHALKAARVETVKAA
jgi:NAD(P)H-dependent FMN reductase